MPIHDQGYRRFGGTRVPRGQGWLVIATAGLRAVVAKRPLIILLLVSWIPFAYQAVKFYLSVAFGNLQALATTPQTFREFLEGQEAFIFFLTIYIGTGLIASDRRANALQIYLSKPLTRLEYVAGKATILAAALLVVTWVPAVLLLAVQAMFAGDFSFIRANAFLLPAITVYSFVQVALATSTMLALSSMSKSPRFVGIMYAGVVFFTDSIFATLKYVMNANFASLVSPTQSLAQLGDVIFRVPPRHDTPTALSLVVVFGIIALAALVLERRIRGVEVVA